MVEIRTSMIGCTTAIAKSSDPSLEESDYVCLLPSARFGFNMRLFDHGLSTALYAGAGPVLMPWINIAE